MKLLEYRAAWYDGVRNGIGPLHYAAQNGHTELVLSLIKAGEEIDALDSSLCTPLQRAILHQHSETVKALLICGASTTKSSTGTMGLNDSAFDLAMSMWDKELAATILNHGQEKNVVVSISFLTIESVYQGWYRDSNSALSKNHKLVATISELNPIVVEDYDRTTRNITFMQLAVRYCRFNLLSILRCFGIGIDFGTKEECRKILQILGWKTSDFKDTTLPDIVFDSSDIYDRIIRYNGVRLGKDAMGRPPYGRSLYHYTFIKDGKPSKRLRTPIRTPELWHMAPDDKSLIPSSAEKAPLEMAHD